MDNNGQTSGRQTNNIDPQNNLEFTPNENLPKPSRSKRNILLILLLVILIAVSSWYFLFRSENQKSNNNQSAAPTSELESSSPRVVYFKSASEEVSNNESCPLIATTTFSTQEIADDAEPRSQEIKGRNLSFGEVEGDKVAYVSDPDCNNESAMSVWVSSDGGQNFTMVFEGAKPTETSVDQITSLKFSSDGKALIFAFLKNYASTNTVKEVDIASKTVKDLFTTKSAGVFIHGYDRTNKKVYYTAGCYNCDGNTTNKLFIRDLVKQTTNTIVFSNTGNNICEGVEINKEFTKALVACGLPSQEGMGAGGLIYIYEYDLKTAAQTTKLALNNKSSVSSFGFRNGDSVPYYTESNGKSVMNLNTKQPMYSGSKIINSLDYVGTDRIVLTQGQYEDFDAISYDVKTKKIINLFSAQNINETTTQIIGVTSNL